MQNDASVLSSHPPRPRFFQPFLIRTLAQALNFQSNTFVSHKTIIPAVLRKAGFDPEALSDYGDPAMGWRREGHGPNGLNGLNLIISYAFRNLYRHDKHTTLRKKITMQGEKPGEWGLTEAGVWEAQRLELEQSEGNLTSLYLSQLLEATGGYNGKVINQMRLALSIRLPKSLAADGIDDHLHNFFDRLIRRDSLRKVLKAGYRPNLKTLISFAVRSAYTDCRGMGVDALTRQLFKARTTRELEKIAQSAQTRTVQEGPLKYDAIPRKYESLRDKVAFDNDKDGGEEDHRSSYDFVDPDSIHNDACQRLIFKEFWERADAQIRAAFPEGKSEEYILALKEKMFEDMTHTEMGEKRGIRPSHAGMLFYRALHTLQKSGEFSHDE